MYVGMEVRKDGKSEWDYQTEKEVKEEIDKIMESHGFQTKTTSALAALIKEEIEFRNENHEDYKLERQLTQEEIETVAEYIYDDYDEVSYLISDLLEVIDERMKEKIRGDI